MQRLVDGILIVKKLIFVLKYVRKHTHTGTRSVMVRNGNIEFLISS